VAAPVYTQLFAYGNRSAAGAVTVVTPDPEFVYIVRDLVFYNYTGTTAFMQAYYQPGTSFVTLFRSEVKPLEAVHAEMRQVLADGAPLIVTADCTGWTYAITGYKLTKG
jgi:hypothetical protein